MGTGTNGLQIDWAFISKREGGQQLVGDVPDAKKSQSGVTIATGFDIGQRSKRDLERLGLPENLINKLKPYCGLKGVAAKKRLRENGGLTIKEHQAKIIDSATKASVTDLLVNHYDAASTVMFKNLPAEAQTVVASVMFQYGSLKKRCPIFWALVTKQKWAEAVDELRDFGDRYASRRDDEADYLEKIVPKSLPKHTDPGVSN